MPKTARKKKVVCLRLSDEEYAALQRYLEGGTYTSVSEFVRDAIRTLATAGAGSGADCRQYIQNVNHLLGEIDHKVDTLVSLTEQVAFGPRKSVIEERSSAQGATPGETALDPH